MSEEWKQLMARNLDRDLELKGISNSERARSAYQQYRGLVFGWFLDLAKEVQKLSRNPRAVLIVEDTEVITVSVGTEMLRLRTNPYPFCSKGWGKLTLTATNQLPIKEAFLWNKDDDFVWLCNAESLSDNAESEGKAETAVQGLELTPEVAENIFKIAFKKYLQL